MRRRQPCASLRSSDSLLFHTSHLRRRARQVLMARWGSYGNHAEAMTTRARTRCVSTPSDAAAAVPGPHRMPHTPASSPCGAQRCELLLLAVLECRGDSRLHEKNSFQARTEPPHASTRAHAGRHAALLARHPLLCPPPPPPFPRQCLIGPPRGAWTHVLPSARSSSQLPHTRSAGTHTPTSLSSAWKESMSRDIHQPPLCHSPVICCRPFAYSLPAPMSPTPLSLEQGVSAGSA